MVKQKSIKKNMVMSTILTAANFVFPLMTYSYVARILSPDGIGKVAFVNSILQYFSYIATLGIPTYGLRECAKVRDNKEARDHLVQELLVINLFSTVIAYIGLFFAVVNITKLSMYKDLFFVMSIYIILNTIGMEWLYQALEEYSYITVRSLLFKSIAVVLTFVLVRQSNDILWYGFISVFTLSANYICNFLNLHKYVSFKKVGKYHLRRHYRPIFTLFFAAIVTTIYANFDVSMLGFMSTEYEVGLYNAAWKIKNIVLSISTAVTAVMIPRIAYYIETNQFTKTKDLLLKSIRVALLLAIPIATYIAIYPSNVLAFVCGAQYTETATTMRILIICIFPLVLTNLFGNQILIPMGLEKRYSQSVFIGMWINVGLNLVLIPRLGAFGAAVGTLVTEIWNVFWMSSAVKDYRMMIYRSVNYLMYVVTLILAGVSSLGIHRLVISLSNFWQLVFTAGMFFGMYYFLLLIWREPLMVMMVSIIVNRFSHKDTVISHD